ncbi:MAG: TIM barrel protein [Chloroflexi bacterium]|nr:TIM barrel protein [Chloroflexota bacterium]
MAAGKQLLFGTAGVPVRAKGISTRAALPVVKGLGLGCMEIEFVQGVRLGQAAARDVGKAATSAGLRLSAHAPYAINLNAHEPDKLAASRERILQTARVGALCGARDITFHPAFYLGDDPAQVYGKVRDQVRAIQDQLREEGVAVTLRPELMGKPTQFGSLVELLDLASELEGVLFTLDISHQHARTGAVNTYEEFMAIFRQVEGRLGRQAMGNMLFHVSGIEYGKRGERKHLVLQKSDFNYRDFLRALKDMGVAGMVICESPNLEEDALLLKQEYEALG